MRPTRRLLVLAWLWLLAAVAASLAPELRPGWLGLGGALLALALGDRALGRRLPLPEIQREGPGFLALGNPHPFRLLVRNPGRARLRLEIHDDHPGVHEVSGLPQELRLGPEEGLAMTWRLRPRQRGPFTLGPPHLLLWSPLGLWRRSARVGPTTEIRVYPDFQQVLRYALLATDDRVAAMGIHTLRRRGEGLEFFQLREYREGDALRQIDWKAVSRRRALVSREYQDEQNQQLVFLLDCGRRLRSEDGDLSHFDHVLNAVLLLSHVALRQGDAVGLMTFSGPERWVPPRRGRGWLRVMQDQIYDLQTTLAPSDLREAAERLMARQRRRALVVVLTNLKDEDRSELAPALALLRQRHLVLLTSLRERALGELLKRPVERFEDALAVASAHHYLAQREAAQGSLAGAGVRALDVEPAELPVALVNAWLEIKRAGLL